MITGLRLPDDSAAARAAQLLGGEPPSPETREALLSVLGHNSEYTRTEIAQAFAGFGEVARVDLQNASLSGDPLVRDGAARGLLYLNDVTASPIAGRCYHLSMSPWQPPLNIGNDDMFVTPPMNIRFSTVKYFAGLSQAELWLRITPTNGDEYSIHGSGAWRAERDRLQLEWSTGFSGLTMDLSMAGDTLAGTANTFWDFPRDQQEARVIGEPIACDNR